MRKILLSDQFWLRSRLRDIVTGNMPGFDRSKHPLIWVESTESLGNILSDHNRQILRWVSAVSPLSYAALLDGCGLAPDDLWRTLQMLMNFRLLEVKTKNHLLIFTLPAGPLEVFIK